MKTAAVVVASLFAVACGGGKKPRRPYAPPTPDERVEAPPPVEEPAEEPEPPPPPPPQEWRAHVDLAPVKGSKLKAAIVRFAQTEGEATHATSDGPLAGLKPGTYHLVIHEAGECGKNAARAGAAWAEAAVTLDVTVARGTPGTVDAADLDLALDGDRTIVGHALVLHADKKGKPAKALGCGVIEADEAVAEDDADAGDDADE